VTSRGQHASLVATVRVRERVIAFARGRRRRAGHGAVTRRSAIGAVVEQRAAAGRGAAARLAGLEDRVAVGPRRAALRVELIARRHARELRARRRRIGGLAAADEGPLTAVARRAAIDATVAALTARGFVEAAAGRARDRRTRSRIVRGRAFRKRPAASHRMTPARSRRGTGGLVEPIAIGAGDRRAGEARQRPVLVVAAAEARLAAAARTTEGDAIAVGTTVRLVLAFTAPAGASAATGGHDDQNESHRARSHAGPPPTAFSKRDTSLGEGATIGIHCCPPSENCDASDSAALNAIARECGRLAVRSVTSDAR